MDESSRFLSLSGLSGIFPGIIAISGALVAHFLILKTGSIQFDGTYYDSSSESIFSLQLFLFVDAAAVLILSILSALYFSFRKAKRQGLSFWTPASKRLLFHLLLPLFTGGALILVLLLQGQFRLIIPMMLIFYGIALVSAGKYTFGEITYLGILEIVTGLLAAILPELGLLLWVLGFGILHIIYGLLMYRRYES